MEMRALFSCRDSNKPGYMESILDCVCISLHTEPISLLYIRVTIDGWSIAERYTNMPCQPN